MCMALSVSAQGLEGVEAAETETAEPTEKKVWNTVTKLINSLITY